MGLLSLFDYAIIAVGAVGFAYQAFCLLVGLLAKPYRFPEVPPKKYAVIISARNEKAVIGNLIDSINNQDYPKGYIDIWVVADNCTDNTADICRNKGAFVVERFNKNEIGKGYALSYLFENMRSGTFGESKIQTGPNGMSKQDVLRHYNQYEGFFIFDADNILESNYITEMNKVFSAGYKIVTSYRNSKNATTNWVSSGSALWFVKESRLLNNSRMLFGASCHVGGTGFMFAREIMIRNGGWKHHLLTEDLEFTMDSVLHGDKVGYAGNAILYDEQPVTFAQSWRQRLRWSRGFLQVFHNYGAKLIHNAFTLGNFSCLDLTLLMFPWILLSVIRVAVGAFYVACGFVSFSSQINSVLQIGISALLGALVLVFIAAITVFCEYKRIGATKKELVAFVLSFPLYVLSYIPISFVAIFSKVEWKPIEHGQGKESINANNLRNQMANKKENK
ncbi:MAG: glycosyltransferase [Candidatus Ancillula sp.]|jgi:cellulose synthase/poly-beta-1,6-N-acetylglucosamine synthase-like glycosyltransferase|nr:glycosyltransferase [Candidatus Ancillula sp.]